jgi:hypothetical protein
VLTHRRIRFTNPVDFNDPFELAPSIEGAVDGRATERLLREPFETFANDPTVGREHYSKALAPLSAALGVDAAELFPFEEQVNAMMPELPAMFRAIVGQLNTGIADTFYSELRSRIGRSVGILSLSEVPDSLLMWAHYAAEHRGFAIGFDTTHEFFNRTLHPSDPARSLRPVEYVTDRPRRAILTDPVDEGRFLVELARDFFLVKSPDWSYEREWRMLLPSSAAETRVASNDQELLLYDLPPETIAEVVVGVRATTGLRVAVAEALAHPELAQVTLRNAQLNPFAFRVDLGP